MPNFLNNNSYVYSLIYSITTKRVYIFLFVLSLCDVVAVFTFVPFIAIASNNEQSFTFINDFYHDIFRIINIEFDLLNVALLTLLQIFLLGVVRFFLHFIINRKIESYREKIGTSLFSLYLRAGVISLSVVGKAEMHKRLLLDIDMVARQVIRPFFSGVVGVFTSIIVALSLFITSPHTTVLIILSLLFLYLIIFIFFKKMSTLLGSNSFKYNSTRSSVVDSGISMLPIVKLSSLEDIFIKKFSLSTKHYSNATSDLASISVASNILVEFFLFTIVVYFIFTNTQSGTEGIVTAAIFAVGAYKLKPSLQQIYTGLVGFKFGKTAIQEIDNDYNVLSCITSPSFKPIAKIQTLEVSDLYFSHIDSDKTLIQGISFVINKGEVVALTGPSGSGKTTLMNILMGLYEAKNCVFKINNVITDLYNNPYWWSKIAYVPQDTFLVNDTLVENITLGVADENIDFEHLHLVLKITSLDNVVVDLPQGIYTVIGETGIKFSGGQAQRVGLARALYTRPAFLFLDEFTSALDLKLEKLIINNLRNYCSGITVILITHRPYPLSWANYKIEI